ncbi:MAG TPA: hypothetical protein PLL98_04850 [Bacillota bacterium]|nr:hypothetical protein [Bacillota bacterium]
MEKHIRSFISIVVAMVMMFSCINVSALTKVSNDTKGGSYAFTDDSGTNVIIKEINKGNGVKVLRQYNNGKLVGEVEITKGSTKLRVKEENGKLKVEDAGSILTKANIDSRSYAASYTLLGRINYGVDPNDYKKHSIRLKYMTTPEVSVYKVNAYKGLIVTLVAAIISVIAVPASIMTDTIKAICVAYGISVISGKIMDKLTVPLSAKIDNYSFRCTDTINSNHYIDVTGKKVYIIDDNKKYKGNTYYEGFIPKDWKTTAFGKSLYLRMFGVVGFSPVSYGSY